MDIDQISLQRVKGRRWRWERWVLVALLLLAWALRLPPTLANRFHPDEALYGTWGLLIGRGRDPWLATVPVYKPPLLPYLIAGTQALFGNSELAVRWPGLAAGLLTVPLTAALARSLYRNYMVAVIAAVGVALSPFAILFSATAFTDPLMVALGLAACVAMTRGRPGWAGVLAGLAFAAKQTGLVWVALAAGSGVARISNQQVSKPATGRAALRFVAGLLLVAGLLFAWDATRVARGAESFWREGVTGYGGLRLIWPQELWARLRGWGDLARYLFVSPVVNGALLVGLPALVVCALTRLRHTAEALTDLLLVSFLLVYLLFHWLWAFPVWDRYLLPLVPVLAVLLGRGAHGVSHILHRASLQVCKSASLSFFICSFVHLSLVILLLLPAFNAARSRYPVGGDHGAYDGIDQVAVFLRRLPEGSVVYHHWLGWHYDYYLFDAPVYLAYWPTPAWLARDVQAFGWREPRYITFPSWEPPARVEWALAGVGYGLSPVLTTTRRDGTPSFTVYRIRSLSYGSRD
jgi:4-amino-4-deoxy-L-arabinose transferase-like glycosyltransferase